MNLKWYLIAALFSLSLVYEYVRHVLIEGHGFSSIIPSLIFYALIIVPLVLWVYAKLERQGRVLAEREKRFRNFIESTMDAVFEVDAEGHFTFMNPAGAEMCALSSPDELLGRRATEFWADPGERDSYLAELMEKGYVVKYPMEARRANGETAYWELTSNVLKDAEGNFAGIRGICRDVTERRRLEEHLEEKVEERTRELRESEERIRRLVETSIDGIISTNENREITLWNKAAERIFGYTKGEALGGPLTLIIPAEYHERHRRGFERYLETGKGKVIGRTVELEGLHKDGSRFPVELSLSCMKTRQGKLFTAVIRDITERKKAEKQLQDYAAQLEHSNMLKDLFTDIMSHDLQNPVAVIKGLSELLVEEDLPEETKSEIGKIQRNADRMAEMIESASKYAKLEGTGELEFEEMDLNEIMERVIHNFRPLIEKKKMKLVYGRGGRSHARVNPVVEDAFANLLSNAIKYSPPGSEIVVEIVDHGGDWRLAVKDQGDGIPNEAKEGIFKRFTRRHKAGVKGTGLGLAIVKRIVELHNGRVWVEDNEPRGSIFYVQLPKEVLYRTTRNS